MAVGDAISGKDGKFKYGATPTEVYITRHNSKRSSGTKETTSSKDASAGWRSFVPDGWFTIEGSFEGFIYKGDTPPTEGAVVEIQLHTDGNRDWTGNGIITDIEETVDVVGADAVAYSGTFKGTGAWARTDNSA